MKTSQYIALLTEIMQNEGDVEIMTEDPDLKLRTPYTPKLIPIGNKASLNGELTTVSINDEDVTNARIIILI